MKMWPMVATAVLSSACVWACNGDGSDDDGEGGQGGEGTGGAASGGAASGGAASGGLGGTVSCEPEDGSSSWGGAGGVGGAGGAGSADIFGEWTDQYSSTYSFDESIIDTGYTTYDVVGFSDGGQYIVAQNSETADYFPCMFTRFDWLIDGEATYLCRTVLGAPSVEEALALPAADRENVLTGCSGFPWSVLTPQ